MKLFYSLLVTIGQCLPGRSIPTGLGRHPSDSDFLRPDKSDPGHHGIPSTPCVNDGKQTVTIVNNDQNGVVTIDHYESNQHCFVEIGPKCNSDGVEVEFTDMIVENVWDFRDDDSFEYEDDEREVENYELVDCYDYVHFVYMSNGNKVET